MKRVISICLSLLMSVLLYGEAYVAKDFSYLPGKLSGFNDNLLKMHFQLYEGYVKNTNQLVMDLEGMRAQGQEKTLAFGALQRRLGWEYDGMRLHELYFEAMGEMSPKKVTGPLYDKIVKDFGSFDAWRKDFVSIGLMRGIGWVILYEDKLGHLVNVWINEHDVGHLAGGNPLLVMDVWEHAYLTQYGLDRGRYIEAFLQVVLWEVIQNRYLKKAS